VGPDADSEDGRGAHPFVRACSASRRLFAHPDWTDAAALDAVLRAAEPAVGDGFAALLLGFDPRVDGLVVDFDAACEAVALRVLEAQDAREVRVVTLPLGRVERCAAARALDALVEPSPRVQPADHGALGLPVLADAAAVLDWRRARERGADERRAA